MPGVGLTDRLSSDKASPFCFRMATVHGDLLLSDYAQGPPGGQRRSKRCPADKAPITGWRKAAMT